MREPDEKPAAIFGYVSAEKRVPPDHPLRAIRTSVDQILRGMTRKFDALYRDVFPPETSFRIDAQPWDSTYGLRFVPAWN